MRRTVAGLAAALAFTACAPRVHLPQGALAPSLDVVMNGHALRLHIANRQARPDLPLLVFATGDGGWHRKDLDAWQHLVLWGYPAAGFDARDYVTHLGPSAETTTPVRLAQDYLRIIGAARAALHLGAAHPVVLVGVSRGAGLAVVAAGDPGLRPQLSGVLAVALTREEEYVKSGRRRGAAGPPQIVQVYDYLPRLGDLAVAVVQSSRDNYLSAAEAHALFGLDTASRRFETIEASNHSFGGAREELYRAMASSLEWIDRRISPHGATAR